MALDVGSVVAKLVADTKQFDKPMQHSVQVIQRFNKAGEATATRVKLNATAMATAAQKTDSFRLAMTRLSRDIKVTGTIFNALEGSIKQAYDAASEGAKIMAAEQFFRNAGKSIAEYRKATNGMVSDAELMKKANLADSMGIDEATFKKLVMVAEASALKTGQSFDYMFNSIIVGTARSSRLLLDNLGIIVSVGQANEIYAAKVNKTVEALSAEEKQLAFVEEVARKSQGTLDEYAQATDRTAESFARFDASLANAFDTVKIFMATITAEFLPAMTDFFNFVQEAIQSEQWASLGEYIGLQIIAALADTLDVFDPGSWFRDAANDIRKEADAVMLKTKFAAMDKRTEKEDQLTSLLRSARPNLAGMFAPDRDQQLQYFANIGKKQIEQIEQVDPHWAGLIRSIQDTARELGVLPKAVKAAADAVIPKKKKGPEETRDYAVPWEDQMMYGSGFKGPSLLQAILADTRKKLDAAAKEDLKKQLHRNKQLLGWELDRIDRIADAEKKRREEELRAIKEAQKEWAKFQMDLGGAVGGSLASGGGLFGAVGGVIGPAIGTAIGGPIGGAIGALIPVIGQIIDTLTPVITLVGAVGDGLVLLIGNGLTPLFEALTPLAEPLKALMGAVGMLVAAHLHPLAFVLRLLTTVAGGLVGVIAAGIASFATFIQMLNAVAQMLFFIFSGHQVGFAFETFTSAVMGATEGVHNFIFGMLEAVATFNNGLVKWIRSSIPGMEDFGRLMFAAQFGLLDPASGDPVDENTSAVEANTAALREFTREFRNLPQSYKVAGAIYASQNAEMRWTGPMRPRGVGERSVDGFANGRWRT